MRASTYLYVAERRAVEAVDLAEDLFKMAQGKAVYSPSEPQTVLGYIDNYARSVATLVGAVLARTSDAYLRDKALAAGTKANCAFIAASFDLSAAEDFYFENISACITP